MVEGVPHTPFPLARPIFFCLLEYGALASKNIRAPEKKKTPAGNAGYLNPYFYCIFSRSRCRKLIDYRGISHHATLKQN